MDDRQDNRRSITRRTALAAVGGAAALALGLPGAGGGLRWDVPAAALEQQVHLLLPRDAAHPISVRVWVDGPRGSHPLAAVQSRGGDRLPVRLAYPYDELVPGAYSYGAAGTDARGRTFVVPPLLVTLRGYRFGC